MKQMKPIKQTTAVILSIVLVISAILGQMAASTKVEAGGYGLSNPVTDRNGVTTWDCIWFGNYWQSNDTTKEPIKWRVLSVDGEDAFLLADQCLDCKKYNDTSTSVTWETCTLRKWLNEDFYNEAFSENEKKAIQQTTVVNEDNLYGTEGGNDTMDNIFLLSMGEASEPKYGFVKPFNEDSKTREAKVTDYAKLKGGWHSTSEEYAGNGDWWLRSPGNDGAYAALVSHYGWVNYDGYVVDGDATVVRPALHINLSSAQWSKAGTVSSSGGEAAPTPSPSAGSSGLSCRPALSLEVGHTDFLNASVYAQTKEEMSTLSSTVSWSSSDISVAEVENGGFIRATAPATYSGADGSSSLWYASGLVSVTGKKEGTAVITGELSDGTSVRCNVTVTKPEISDTSGSEGNGGSLEIGEDKESSADDGTSGVAQFFPATWSLSSSKYPVQISQTENEDGTFTLKASVGIGRSDLFDKDTEWSKYKKACKTANENSSSYDILESYRELYGLKSSTAIHSSGWKGSKKPSLSIMGYVENTFDKYGNLISSEGIMAGDMSWSGDISWQFATPVGPMYLKLGAEGTASLEGGPSWDNKEKKMSLDGKLSVTPAISLTGGYGIDKVASISATGKASVGVQAFPPSKGTFTAEASVNVYALFVINHTWTLAKYQKELWDTVTKKKSLMRKSNLFLPQEDMTFMNTGFATEDTGWTGGRKARSGQQKDLTLKEGLLPASLPMIAATGDKKVMVWQDYEETRNVADSSVLMYSVYEGGVWSNPQAVYDDGYGDAFADLQVINGEIHLTWQKQKVKASAGDADTAMSQMAEKAEIYYARFDSTGNAFTGITQVTDNSACDMLPKFVKGKEQVQVAWVRNSANSILQSEGTNFIYTSAWNGSGFGSEKLLTESPGTVERYVSYVQNDTTKAMYVTKANGIMAVQSSDNVVAEELGGLMSKAEDGEIASIDYIGGQLRFIRNGLLYCYDPDTDKVTSYPAGDGAFDGTAVYCTNGTKSGYIWSAYDKDTDKGRIVASMSTDTGYSNPVTICETSGVVSRYLAPVLTEKGDWNIALNQENTQSGIHSLTWLCQEEKQDIRLVSAYVNENDVVNGLTGVDYVFTNTGDAAAHQMTAQITFADGTTVEKSVTVDAQPGETVSGTFYADFSQVDKGQNVRIAMFESGQQPKDENTVADVVEKNNLSLVGTAAEEAGKIKVTAYVTNKEKQSADADITLYGDKDKKNPLASQKGFMIPAGQTKQVVFTVEPELIQYNENQAAYLTLYAEAVGGDYDLADNVAYLALYQGEKVNANTEEKGMKEPVVKPEPTSLPTKTPEPQNTMPTKASNAIQKPAFTETPVPASTPMPNGTKVKDKKGVTYTITKSGQSKGEAAYTAPKSKKITSAVIPNTVKIGSTTYTVTSIRANAFKSCKKLKKITIGKEIKVIGKNAFYGCAKLKNIIIKTTKLTNKKVGAKAFAKLHKKVKIKVPKKKLSAYKKLLKKKGVTGKKQMIKK